MEHPDNRAAAAISRLAEKLGGDVVEEAKRRIDRQDAAAYHIEEYDLGNDRPVD